MLVFLLANSQSSLAYLGPAKVRWCSIRCMAKPTAGMLKAFLVLLANI